MTHARRLFATATLALAVATPAFAGPPLLCHPFDIGGAKSLPWDGTKSWSQGRADYPLQQLVADTEAILQPSTPVIVRMETLRRAALYASQDPVVAGQLVDRLSTKASERPADGLAALDAAYAIEALHQVTLLSENGEFRGRVAGVRKVLDGRRGRALLTAAVQAHPSDPAVAFAAALIAMDLDRPAYGAYAARARAGVAQDPLLARNISHLS